MQTCLQESPGALHKLLMPAALETDFIGLGCGLGFGAVKGPQVMVMCRDPRGNELVDLEVGGAQIG